MDSPTPPPVEARPSDAQDGHWTLVDGGAGNAGWVWEEDVPDPDVEAVLAEGGAQIAALEADVRARRQVCRRIRGAQFSETVGIVALARAAIEKELAKRGVKRQQEEE